MIKLHGSLHGIDSSITELMLPLYCAKTDMLTNNLKTFCDNIKSLYSILPYIYSILDITELLMLFSNIPIYKSYWVNDKNTVV